MPPRLSPCPTIPGPHTGQRRAIPNFRSQSHRPAGVARLHATHHTTTTTTCRALEPTTPNTTHRPNAPSHYITTEGPPGLERLCPPFPPLTLPHSGTVVKIENSTAATRSSWGTRMRQRTKKKKGGPRVAGHHCGAYADGTVVASPCS